MSIPATLDTGAAERRAMKISLRLDAIAENYEAVMPMIREAIKSRDDLALGYRSPSDYVSDRFGRALSKLGMELRREVVRELSEAGLSTRAIAPVVGVSHMTVANDMAPPVKTFTPQTPEGGRDVPSIQTERPEPVGPAPQVTARPPVIGIDGKTYTAAAAPRATPRRALTDVARDLGQDLRQITERFERLADDDRLARNRNEVAAHLRHHLARALKVLADLEQEINSQERNYQ